MDIEEQTVLLEPVPEDPEIVKVFPLFPHIRKDAMVRVAFEFEACGASIESFR